MTMPRQGSQRPTITVGFDGSPQAATALGWAAREAVVDASTLSVVCVRDANPTMPWSMAAPAALGDRLARDTEELAIEARSLVTEPVDLEVTVQTGLAGPVLAASAEDSYLLVVGTAGHVGLGGWFRGSVSRYLLHHTSCPLVLAGPHCHADAVRRIVLCPSVDTDRRALAFAARWLATRPTPVLVLATYALPALVPDLVQTADEDELRQAVAANAAAYVDELRGAVAAPLDLTTEVAAGLPIEVLDRHGHHGDLVVAPRGAERDVPLAHGCGAVCVV